MKYEYIMRKKIINMMIGNCLITIAGKLMKTMIGKSHHRSIPKITTIISMSLQMSMSILMRTPLLKQSWKIPL